MRPVSARARVITFVTIASIFSADNASPLASGVERFTAAPVIRTVAPGADLHSGQMADENQRIFSHFPELRKRESWRESLNSRLKKKSR